MNSIIVKNLFVFIDELSTDYLSSLYAIQMDESMNCVTTSILSERELCILSMITIVKEIVWKHFGNKYQFTQNGQLYVYPILQMLDNSYFDCDNLYNDLIDSGVLPIAPILLDTTIVPVSTLKKNAFSFTYTTTTTNTTTLYINNTVSIKTK